MKKTLFLSAILGAVLAAPAMAVTYGGTIYTYTPGSDYNLHNASFTETTIVDGNYVLGTTDKDWHHFSNSTNSIIRYTSGGSQTSSAIQFNDLTIGGVIVDADSAITTLENNGTRSFYIGKADTTSGSSIHKDFTIKTTTGTINLRGTQEIEVDNGKTLTLAASSSVALQQNATITLSGNGTVALDTRNVTFANGSSITVGANNTLALTTGTGWTMVDEETPRTSGNGFGTATYTRNFGTSIVNNGTITVNGSAATMTDGVVTSTCNSENYYINDATTYSSNADFANAQKVIINNNVTVTGATGGENGFFHEEVVVNGSLIMGNKDLMGWSGTNVKKLTLEDGATIKLTHDTNETFAGALTMKGTSTITGATASTEPAGQWDIYGSSSITVENGATATISTKELRTRRDNVSINVGNNATLAVSANLTKNGGNGVINKTGSGTLTITGSIANGITLNNNAGTTIVKDVTLTGGTFKGVTFTNTKVNGTITLNGFTGDGKLQTALSGLTKSDAQGASSTINLGGGEYTFNAETTVNAHHLVFGGNTEINGHGYDCTGHVITLNNGASVDAGANELKIESKATLKLTNGTVTSGSVILGHNVVTNTDQTKNVGTLTMAGGSITTGFIKSNAGYAASDNTFTMTGGTLTFTKPASETVMVDGPDLDEEGNPIQIEQTNTYNAIDGVTATITGGTLSTAEAAWKIDNANVTLSGVTISGANTATLSHVNLGNNTTKIDTNTTVTGGITSVSSSTDKYAFLVENNSTLTFTGADYDLRNAGAGIAVTSGSELVVESDASLTLKTIIASSTDIDNNGKLTVKEGGSVDILGNGHRNAFLKEIALQGNLTVAQDATLTTKTLTGGSNSELTVNGTVNINEASTVAALSGTGSLKLSNSLTVTGGTTTIGALTLGDGSTITLGSADENGHNFDLTTTTLTVNGDATMNANLVVSNGGTMDFSHAIAAGSTLTMGCSVKIGNKVTVVIDDSIVAGIVNRGETVTIIDGVDQITSLGSWNFQNAAGQSLDWANLRLEVGTDGKSIVVAPEPATATLSLLALAALAARRRRH